MSKDELIAKQQLEIEELKKDNGSLMESLDNIHKMLVCIGGPLNDNYHQYSKEQLRIFFRIHDQVNML